MKSTGDNGGWQIEFSQRRVAIDTGQVVVNVIDRLLAKTTPWQCIEEATDCAADGTCLIDCVALGKAVETVEEGSAPFVQAMCRNAVRAAGRRAVEAFSDVFESDDLVFSGRASIEAGRLGSDDFESMLQKDPAHRDGAWTGFLLSSDSQQLGAWTAKRAPK